MANALRSNKVGRLEFGFYCVTFVLGVLLCVAYVLNMLDAPAYEPAILKTVDRILFWISIIAMLAIAYYANRRIGGKQFWYRFISLSFPLGIWVGLVTIALFIAATIIGLIDIYVYRYPDVLLVLFSTLLGCFWTWKYMLRIGSTT